MSVLKHLEKIALKSLEEAIAVCCANVQALDSEYLSINNAFMRISADHIVSFINVPSFDRSSMDGYAIGKSDLEKLNAGKQLSLRVTATIRAGAMESKPVNAGETCRIMTGALLPEGSAAVIKQEDVQFFSDRNLIVVSGKLKPDENICRAGHEFKAGDRVAARGQVLQAEVLERIAACGIATIAVHKTPRVYVIDTGSELLLPGSTIKKGQIYASSRDLISGKIKGMHAIPVLNDVIVEDDIQAIANEIEKAVLVSDMVVITGGTGKGVYDLVYRVFEYINAKRLVRGVDILPGKGSSAALYKGKILYNVSGNPCAAGLLFEVLIKPSLQKLKGELISDPEWFDIQLYNSVKHIKPVRSLCQGEMIFTQGSAFARPVGKGHYSVKNVPLILDLQAGQGLTGDTIRAKLC